MSEEAARDYVDSVLDIPATVSTAVVIDATSAQMGLDSFIHQNDGRSITVHVDAVGRKTYSIDGTGLKYNATGGIVEFMAAGGIRPLSGASVVPPNTLRVVGDRGDVPESYIPWDGSASSRETLARTMAAFGVNQPAIQPSMVGIEIRGTLDTPWGPSEIRGVVKSELSAAERSAAAMPHTRGRLQ